MRDARVGDTLYFMFTTRSFSTGAPATLSGTPVVSAYEDNSITQITAGITLGVDHDSVTGLNLLTVVASGANGFEAGKAYALVITTGTVGGVSVVGEVVAEFTLEAGAAFARLGAPAGASIAADLLVIDNFVDELESRLTAARAGYLDNLNGHTPQTGDSYARIGAAGAGLTAIPWNAAWDVEVESEVMDGLNAYDPPTNAEMVARTLLAASYATAAKQADIEADTQDIQTRIPAALVSGRMDSYTGAMGTGVVDAAALAADAIDEIWDEAVEGSTTARQLLRGFASALLAKLAGAATTSVTIRDLADTKNRISATVDADGNRTAVTLDLT